MAATSIEWTDATWNPVTGCTKVSPGCLNCYAERMARRLRGMGQPNYAAGFQVAVHEHMLERPLAWRRPRMVFVNSMSDLFHPDVPDGFIADVFGVMARASRHVFQVLTKRSARLAEMAPRLLWPGNLWMGVSVESAGQAGRVAHLLGVPAAVRFVSFEPLLGPVAPLDLAGLDWVIVGGESGPGARAMSPEWACAIRDMCGRERIPFFFKQWGGTRKRGRLLEGRVWDQMPCAPSPL